MKDQVTDQGKALLAYSVLHLLAAALAGKCRCERDRAASAQRIGNSDVIFIFV